MVGSAGRIVVGVDGSLASLDAVRWAAEQARLTGSEVEAVLSWQFPTMFASEFYTAGNDWPHIAQLTMDSALSQVGDLSPVRITARVVQGHPAEVLIAASAEADLLVVGSRGHGGFAGALLGSVSEYVAAHATCPVLVIRHTEVT